MLLNLKKVGDPLSLDDYNALVYLIRRNISPIEEITLNNEKYVGLYGEYTLNYNESQLVPRDDGYYIISNTGFITLEIDGGFTGYYNTNLSLTTTSVSEVIDETENTVENYDTVHNYSSTPVGTRQQITIQLSNFSPGQTIKFEALITLSYSGKLIDKLSGSLDYVTDNIIKDSEVLESQITNAEDGDVLYLEPARVFELSSSDSSSGLNSEIVINKTVTLVSGNVPAVLDAKGNHRIFRVTETGKLIMRNIELRNGNSHDETIGAGLGGAVYVHSEVENNVGYTGKLECEYCKFQNNTAAHMGGAVFNNDGIVVLSNCTFYNNKAVLDNVYGDGGAVYNKGEI
jgi:hypothetical protein